MGGGTPAQTETNLKLEIIHILPQSDPEYDASGVRKPTMRVSHTWSAGNAASSGR